MLKLSIQGPERLMWALVLSGLFLLVWAPVGFVIALLLVGGHGALVQSLLLVSFMSGAAYVALARGRVV